MIDYHHFNEIMDLSSQWLTVAKIFMWEADGELYNDGSGLQYLNPPSNFNIPKRKTDIICLLMWCNKNTVSPTKCFF